MTTMLKTNGQMRKTLADQLDRLDLVLDGLSDGLHEAVATAVQTAVSQVLRELLGQPGLLAQLQPVNPWAEMTTNSVRTTEKKP